MCAKVVLLRISLRFGRLLESRYASANGEAAPDADYGTTARRNLFEAVSFTALAAGATV